MTPVTNLAGRARAASRPTWTRRAAPVVLNRRLISSSSRSRASSPELEKYSELEPRPIPLSSLFSFSRPRSESDALSSASYVTSEIPRRLARVIRSFDKLPYIVGTNPFIARVHSLYNTAFHELSNVPDITDQRGIEEYAARLEAHVQMHSNDIPTLSKGFSECARYMSAEDTTNFLNQTLTSRIGIRLIAEQYVAISRSTPATSTPDSITQQVTGIPGGIIDPECSPERMVRMCGAFVSSLCEATFGVSPEMRIDGIVDARFAYVPVHLEYILTELLKNSYRATAEVHTRSKSSSSSSRDPLPPVLVTISPSPTSLSIRIRDSGGGIPPTHLPKVFSYAFTTARGSSSSSLGRADGDEVDEDSGGGPYAAQHIGGAAAIDEGGENDGVNLGMFGNITAAGVQSGMGTIAGFGYGLPLARLYATYFGGSLELMSLHGHGTDVFIRLRRLDQDSSIRI